MNPRLIEKMLIALFLNASDLKKCESVDQIIKTIISLSYVGDVRLLLKIEDEKKYDKIFNGSKSEFLEIYERLHEKYLAEIFNVYLKAKFK